MSEMIERVARALWAEREKQFPKFAQRSPDTLDETTGALDTMRAQARAAIAAMREPTGEMKDAGADSYGVPTPAIGSLPLSVISGQPTKAWKAMIDAALTRAPAVRKNENPKEL